MKTENPLREKSYMFAKNTVIFCRKLQEQNEYILSKQLLRSGTSIGTNVEEAMQAQSKRDFVSKLSISLKEACETQYWLRLIRDTTPIHKERSEELMNELKEILALLTAIIKTSKENLS